MQSAKVKAEEDFSLKDLMDRGFPLDYLFKNHGIEFTYFERNYIQTVYLLHLDRFQNIYERDDMPMPCIGTAMELWGLIQSTFSDERNADSIIHLRLNKIIRYYTVNPEVFHEILSQALRTKEIHTILRGIFQKICREPKFIFNNYMGNFYNKTNERLMNLAQYLVPYTLEYGQFPHGNVSQKRYFELDDYEKYAISILYIQLLWSGFLKHSKFVMPLPTGTGMEIFFMVRISILQDGLEGPFHHEKTSSSLSQICDGRFLEKVNPTRAPFQTWSKKFYQTIFSKMNVCAYRDYLRKQKRDISLIHELSNRLPMDMVEYVEQMYKENVFQDSPFQFLRDRETGLWFLSRLPL